MKTNPKNVQNSRNSYVFQKMHDRLEDALGYELNNFKITNNIIQWLHRPTDAAALGVFRFFFGLCMLIDIPEEREGSNLDIRFGNPKDCHFPLFDFIQPLSLPYMGLIYGVMWLGALGICLGYYFKVSCLMFSMPYWYIFLMDKPAWNNHSYLYGLCGILLFFTNANAYMSVDYIKQPKSMQIVPYWNYFLIKFQFFILYFYAGCKKLTIEWLSGYSMTNLGFHWIFNPFTWVLSVELIELLIIHWFTAIFDFTIAFWMTWNRTRVWATPFMISFHIINSRLFTIGMFPWVCLSEIPLFFSSSWPRKLLKEKQKNEQCAKINEVPSTIKLKNKNHQTRKIGENYSYNQNCLDKPIFKASKNQKIRTCLICLYCCLQLFLPYSHFITKGYNNWTNGLYGYSWDMMIHSYNTIHINIKIIENNNYKIHYMEPFAFTNYDRWTKNADMAVQYAKCIERNLINDYKFNPQTVLSSTNFSIYFDIWCSMNGRFQQRTFKPIDILKAHWSPFQSTDWILPILHEFNDLRPRISEITNAIYKTSNYSDVLFVADFPGLTLENYISTELNNVTLSVLTGKINIQNNNGSNIVLRSGENILIPNGEPHNITTISSYPSSYMYSFINKTLENLKEALSDEDKSFVPLKEEFLSRCYNYYDFFYHLGNSFLFLVFGVPIPVRLRD